jgi:hypothetical protein
VEWGKVLLNLLAAVWQVFGSRESCVVSRAFDERPTISSFSDFRETGAFKLHPSPIYGRRPPPNFSLLLFMGEGRLQTSPFSYLWEKGRG